MTQTDAQPRVRVLVVEDSLIVSKQLVHLLSADPQIDVVGTAADGIEALTWLEHNPVDVVTMDIVMPRLNGLEATRRIMSTRPVPIIIISGGYGDDEAGATFSALEAGAVAFMGRPSGGLGTPEGQRASEAIRRMVKLMAEVKLVRRRAPMAAAPLSSGSVGERLIALGASAGGPPVVASILSELPGDLAAAVLLVQHIDAGFVQGLVDWLRTKTALPVHCAADGQPVRAGQVYVAPADRHMTLGPNDTIALNSGPPEHGVRPAVSCLFRSLAAGAANRTAAALLTGMGVDGAAELRSLKAQGALTLAQVEDSSVVHGMPGEAIRLGAARYVLSPPMIARSLGRWATDSRDDLG